MGSHFRVTRLPNGVRIATAAMPCMKTVTVGFWAAVGGRHEAAKQSGIAHFIGGNHAAGWGALCFALLVGMKRSKR